MSQTTEQIQSWLNTATENEHIEFKEAKNNFSFDKLLKYCAALANEKGGKIILGITDKIPRRIVGSLAFRDTEKTKLELIQKLHIRIDLEEISHPEGRILVFHVPPRPVGIPIQVDGKYWMRGGESLISMTSDMLKRIFQEDSLDFSNEICEKANLEDLDKNAIENFRELWIKKTNNPYLQTLSPKQLLQDAELVFDNSITYAALILLGKRQILSRCLANAEVVFEYRSNEANIRFQKREEFREGFLSFHDRIWQLVNLHNDVQHFQDGLFLWDIATFNEEAVREAILNAICHRDYRVAGSIFVRQCPNKIEIVSAGGFPEGITQENLLYYQVPRNRRIAEVLSRCGLVERSGQGFDTIYRKCIQETKPLPDFAGTDNYHVYLTLHGVVQDVTFLRFLENIGLEIQKTFNVDDFLVLEMLRSSKKIPENLKDCLPNLYEKGIIERVGRGRGTHYILSKKYYTVSNQRGVYTRKKGLDRNTNKELIVKHLKHHQKGKIKDFLEVFPSLTRNQIHSLLKDLKKEDRIQFMGEKKTGHWELME